MEYIHYCKNCKKTFSVELRTAAYHCPECNTELVETQIPVNEWRSKTDDEKNALKEEFESYEVKTYANQPSDENSKRSSGSSNGIGNALKVIGYIMIGLSIIAGFIIMADQSVVFGIAVGIGGAIGGLVLVGFSEIINLLQDIKNKE